MRDIKSLKGWLDLKRRFAYDLPNKNYERLPISQVYELILTIFTAFSAIALFFYAGIIIKSIGIIWLNAVYVLLYVLFNFAVADSIQDSKKLIGFLTVEILASYYWFVQLGF